CCSCPRCFENSFHVRNDDEAAIALADALDEFRAPAHADLWCLLNGGGFDVSDIVNFIGEDAGNGRLAVHVHFHHNDTSILVGFRPVHAEHDPEVGQRHNASADVDETADKIGCIGHLGNRHEIENFADPAGFDGEELVIE